nr:head-tail connector protein [Falsirhodobacter halotolerans]
MKTHCRIDHDAEDMVLFAYAEAAQAQIEHWIGRRVYARASDLPPAGSPSHDPYQLVADASITVAVLMLVGRMYDDERTGGANVGFNATPPAAVQSILAGYRVFRSLSDE